MINVQIGGGLQPTNAPVENLGKDLANLFGAVSKGVETYNTIGETAAKLDFRDISYRNASAINDIEKRMTELAPDDAKGYESLMGEMESLKDNYSTGLAKYSGHQAAYDAFIDSSASSLQQLDAKSNVINEHRHKASGLQSLALVAKDGDLGLMANPTSFDASLLSLKPFYGEKAVAATQTAYFEPLFAQATQNKNSQNIEQEMSVIDPALGYATVETVQKFMNAIILKDSEMASIEILEDKKGNKTFGVASKFTDEQNSRLVAIANFYMGKHAPAASGEKQYPFLNALSDTVSKAESTIQNTDSTQELQRIELEIKNQFEAYNENPEKSTIVKDSPQHQKLYKTYADVMTSVNKRTVILNAVASGHTVAENTASPIVYRIQNFAKLMYPEDKTAKDSVGTISNDDIKAAYKHIDNESLAAFQSGNFALAQTLSNKYRILTGDTTQLDKTMDVLGKTGLSTATTTKEVSAQMKLTEERFNRGDILETEYFALMRGFEAQILNSKDGKLTAASGTGMKQAIGGKALEKWSANPNNQKKLLAAKQSPWLSDAKITPETFQNAEKMLIKQGKMKPWDDPSAIGKLVATTGLVYGINKTLLPKLNPSLTERQMEDGMTQFIRQYSKEKKVNISTEPDKINITVDPSSTTYLVQYKLSNGRWATDNILISPRQIAIHSDYIKRNPSKRQKPNAGKEYVSKFQ
jgi:hypothetical protein